MRASVLGVLSFWGALSCVSCHEATLPGTQASPIASVTSAAPAATPILAAPSPARQPAPASEAAPKLRFIEDDYQAARAEATRRKIPLFVEVWASWCHSCMSLKEVVFPDPKLGRFADDFVWLAVDSEEPSNESFLQRFPARSLPTLFIIEPEAERAKLKWIGAATAEELASVFEDAEADAAASLPAGASGGSTNLEATALFLQGNHASAEEKPEEAVALYQKALLLGTTDWERRSRALEALSMRFSDLNRAMDAVNLADREAARMPPGTSRVNVLANAINASSALAPGSKARRAVPRLLELARRVAEDPAEPILVDDRSSLYEALVAVFAETNRPESTRLAENWVALLEQEAARAKDSETRRVWDPHRLEAYLALGQPERAVPMLEASEREEPSSYNAPSRLARAHLALGQLELARADVERALARCTVPRKLRIYMLKADILVAAKDTAGARVTLEEAVQFARKNGISLRFDRLVQAIERRARDLGAK
jgi:tetratricopeptide (TPR) repeat protein